MPPSARMPRVVDPCSKVLYFDLFGSLGFKFLRLSLDNDASVLVNLPLYCETINVDFNCVALLKRQKYLAGKRGFFLFSSLRHLSSVAFKDSFVMQTEGCVIGNPLFMLHCSCRIFCETLGLREVIFYEQSSGVIN